MTKSYTFRDILDRLPVEALAKATGLTPDAVRMWKHRGRIPHEWFPEVARVARRLGVRGCSRSALQSIARRNREAA